MSDTQGASPDGDRAARLRPQPATPSSQSSIPSAFSAYADRFLAESEAKRVRFSEPNPSFWRELLAAANPPTLTVCRHLEGVREDRACRCGYPGSVWADGDRVLFTMGDQWGSEEGMRAPRIEREAEIATAQLLTCLYNNAGWLIELAASAIEARQGHDPQGHGAQHESAGPKGDAQTECAA